MQDEYSEQWKPGDVMQSVLDRLTSRSLQYQCRFGGVEAMVLALEVAELTEVVQRLEDRLNAMLGEKPPSDVDWEQLPLGTPVSFVKGEEEFDGTYNGQPKGGPWRGKRVYVIPDGDVKQIVIDPADVRVLEMA